MVAALDVPVPQRHLALVLEDHTARTGARRQHLVAVDHPRVAVLGITHLMRHQVVILRGNTRHPKVGGLRVVRVGVYDLEVTHMTPSSLSWAMAWDDMPRSSPYTYSLSSP